MTAALRKNAIILFLLTLSLCLSAQPLWDDRYDVSFQQLTVTEAIDSLSHLAGVNIAYSSRFFTKFKTCTVRLKQAKVEQILTHILSDSQVDFKIKNGQVLLFRDRSKIELATVFGQVKDQSSGEQLAYAVVYCPKLQKGTTANEYGYFSLSLPKGDHKLSFQYIGMKERIMQLSLEEDLKLKVELESDNYLSEIIVDSDQPTTSTLAAVQYDQPQLQHFITNAPGLGGEQDLMQTVRSIAGVQSGAGGIGGYYVRGGSHGHNLILMDGVPVYNPGHMLGLYSIFNPSATRDLKVYKSGFSARYGGRLSSVIDVYIKEGNSQKWTGEVGFSPQSANVTLEGPMPDKKGSIFLAGRHSTFGYFSNSLIKKTFFPIGDSDIRSKYYDLNVKINRRISSKDRLYWSFYYGGDKLYGVNQFEDDESFYFEENNLQWGNIISSLRWNHTFNSKLFANTNLSYSEYASQTQGFFENDIEGTFDDDFSYREFGSSNRELALKTDFDFLPNNVHQIRAGLGVHSYFFNPVIAFYDEFPEEFLEEFDSFDLDLFSGLVESQEIGAFQLDLYIEDKINIREDWQLSLGLRNAIFSSDGTTFSSFEPRLFVAYQIKPGFKWTASLSKMTQFLHLVANSEINFPHDIWVPSNEDYIPETTFQVNMGLVRELQHGAEIRANVYYKQMNGILGFPDSIPSRTLGLEIEEDLILGSSQSYGLELELYKHSGRLQYLFNYTWSKAQRQFDEVNIGDAYPFQFDRRHEFKTMFTYQFKPNLLLGLKAYVGSGHPYLFTLENTLENGFSPIDLSSNTGGKNQERGDWQHRIDLSATYHLTKRKLEHRFKLEVYNTYNKSNPMFFYLNPDFTGDSSFQPGFSIPIVPSFHYTLKF